MKILFPNSVVGMLLLRIAEGMPTAFECYRGWFELNVAYEVAQRLKRK